MTRGIGFDRIEYCRLPCGSALSAMLKCIYRREDRRYRRRR